MDLKFNSNDIFCQIFNIDLDRIVISFFNLKIFSKIFKRIFPQEKSQKQ